MSTTSIVFGVLLVILGVAGYGYGLMTGHASPTALIPAAFGLVIAILGAVAASNEGLRKHLMHAAVVIALIGFIAPLGRVLSNISGFTISAASLSQLAMSTLCLIFVVLAVRSFIAARRDRVD